MKKSLRLAAVLYILTCCVASGLESQATVESESRQLGHKQLITSKLITSTISESLKDRAESLMIAQFPPPEISDPADKKRFDQVMEYAIAYHLSERPLPEIMQAIAQQFLGASYKAHLLDQANQETLVITLNKFDCVLFVETILALARGIAVKDYSQQTFVNHLRDQRYGDGNLNGYCSRLHYFSQWIDDNQRRGTVNNIALELGGVSRQKTLNYMSKHRGKYPSLVRYESNYQCIVAMEANLKQTTVNFIPHDQIRKAYNQLQPGDIIGIATTIPGLDVTHTGLVYRTADGNIGFIHASPAGKVTIARDLQRYARHVRHSLGIVVARPVDPGF
ncbi:N-acetylmuramoyl-L-alanine amidase-like domain-containing protein [Moorena sp. SIO3H5]|uniref:N-acetylmuramoyl-L-alanine amidase-like domain-containing protein n=1 Tax=Moorena sp. SIO3H5 TaxID=2607834 RepID=UPI0013BDE4F0|nr:N-acetylmuramoyl-L-alanine amidase-like domain-containing protein [Moorena sp. SIO3H5]NEO69877.1 DUF1460 domain-containing protein [Moorena sp. SIO3H5]